MSWWKASLGWLGKLVVTVGKEEIEAIVKAKIAETTAKRKPRSN